MLRIVNSNFAFTTLSFTNKAVPKPVFAKHVQSQHQIDLIDLSKDPVKTKGKLFK